MATEKIFNKITDEEFYKSSISSLATRPNAPANFGTGGLTSSDLRKRFDTLPEILKGRINAIIDAFESGAAASEFCVVLDGEKYTLEGLVGMISTGELAKLIKASKSESLHDAEDLETIQSILWAINKSLSEKLEHKGLAWNKDGTTLINEAGKNEGAYTRTAMAPDRFAVQKVPQGATEPTACSEMNEHGMSTVKDSTTALFSADGIHFEKKTPDGSSVKTKLSFPEHELDDEIALISHVEKATKDKFVPDADASSLGVATAFDMAFGADAVIKTKNGYKKIPVSGGAEGDTLVRRGVGGVVAVGTPGELETQCATPKFYVDDADIVDIVIAPSGTGIDGKYTIELIKGNGDTVSGEIDLPLEAVKVADIDDYVAEDGKHMLKVTYADGKELDIELDELFKGIINEEQVKTVVKAETADKVTEDEVKKIVATETEGEFVPDVSKVEEWNSLKSTGMSIVGSPTDASNGYLKIGASTERKAYRIPIRNIYGNVESNKPENNSDATPKFYVDNADTANANKIANHEKRIENLESALLTFIEVKESAYERDVPFGVGKNAVLSSISGASKGTNLLDPATIIGSGTDVIVNEDGSVSYDMVANSSVYVTISLSQGMYFVDNIGGYTTEIVIQIMGSSEIVSTLPAYIYLDADGSITIRCSNTSNYDDGSFTSKFQISKVEYDGEEAPWESYYNPSKHATVTAVESYSAQLLDPNEIKVGLFLPNGNLSGTSGQRSFEIYLEAGTYTLSSNINLDVIRKRYEGSSTSLSNTSTPYTFTHAGGYIGYSVKVPTSSTANIEDAILMLNKGDTTLPYIEYGTIDTFEIPAEIQAINGYGKDGFILDLESKITEYEGEVTDVSAYLKDYNEFKTMTVQGGGKVRFVNEHELAVPSTITYVKAKE